MPDIANEPAQDSCATEAVVTPEVADAAPVLTNYRTVVETAMVRGKEKQVALNFALPVEAVTATLSQIMKLSCDPRGLFHFDFDAGKAMYLDNEEALFAYVRWNAHAVIRWINSGLDCEAVNFLSKKEFYHAVRQTVRQVQRISGVPTYPPLPDVFYTFRELPPPDPGCTAFKTFLDALFPASPVYRILIASMFITPLLSKPGKPIFLIRAKAMQKSGKSVLAQFVGVLYGGLIDLNPKSVSSGSLTEHAIVQQLLTPSALERVVVRFDNAVGKTVSTLLAMICTAENISCRPAYGRDQVSRSTASLTMIFTSNHLSYDSDLRRRVVCIEICPPPRYERLWVEKWTKHLQDNRLQILSDMIHLLGHVGDRIAVSENRISLGDWEATALAAACETQDEYELAIRTILRDQGQSDAEQQEFDDFSDHLAKMVSGLSGYDPTKAIFIDRAQLRSWIPEGDCWDIIPAKRTHKNIEAVFKRGGKGWSRDLDRWPTDHLPSRPRGYIRFPDGCSMFKAGESYELQYVTELVVAVKRGRAEDSSQISSAPFTAGKDYN